MSPLASARVSCHAITAPPLPSAAIPGSVCCPAAPHTSVPPPHCATPAPFSRCAEMFQSPDTLPSCHPTIAPPVPSGTTTKFPCAYGPAPTGTPLPHIAAPPPLTRCAHTFEKLGSSVESALRLSANARIAPPAPSPTKI